MSELLADEDVALPKMEPKIKRVWLRALRSKKYKQGTGELHPDNKFCCLGVLCDVLYPNSWQDHICTLKGDSGGLLPKLVRQRAKLDREAQLKLSNMNDQGNSFRKIASFIEKNL